MASPVTSISQHNGNWFELIFDGAPEAIIVVDRDFRIVGVNRSTESLFGYARDELIGRPLETLVPQWFRDRHRDLLAQSFTCPPRRSMASRVDLPGLRRDGTELPIEMALNGIDSAGGLFTIVSIIDITERKRAEEAQRRMTALVESADDAILSKTLDGVIRSWNPAAQRLLGYGAEEIIGKPVTLLLPEDRLDEEAMILEQIRRGRRVAHFETIRRRKDGTLVDVSLTISPILDGAGLVIGASKIMRDITEKKQSLEQLRRLNAELETRVSSRTAELREREAMLQEIHHRVKNNLQVISSLINMQMRSLTDAPMRLALQECRARVATMAQIHEMLYQAADYARVPFWKFARELSTRVLSASGISPSSVTLRFELEELSLAVDKAIPCGLILNELMTNALKYAFPNAATGEIRLELRRLGGRDILLSVSDSGIGLPPGFESEKSSSLGMHLVRVLARQLDARVETIGQPGTTHRFIFAEQPP